jgi:MFS family permease
MVVFYGWWIVLACFVVAFYMAGTVFYSFTAFVEPFAAEFGWSYTQISFAFSLRGLEMGIFAPLIGVFIDRFGSRIVMMAGAIIVGSGMLLLSMTQSLMMFYGAFLLLGLGAGGCTSIVVMTSVAHWFDKKASFALGLAAAGFGSGGLLVPVVVWMIETYQWRTTLVILGIMAWAICIPLSMVVRGKPAQYGLLPDGGRMDPVDSGPMGSKESLDDDAGVPPPMNVTLREATRDSNFWYFNVAEAIRMMIVVSIIMHIMPYLDSLGVPRGTSGLAAGGMALFSVAGRIGFGYFGDAFEKRKILAVAYVLMSLGLVVFSILGNGSWTLVVFLMLFAPGFGGAMTMRASLIREYFGTLAYGKIMGLSMGIGSTAAIIGPTLAGWTFDTTGSYRPLWMSYIGLSLIAIWLLLKIKPLVRN